MRTRSGSRVTLMKGTGHFPMIENYPKFREYLLAELNAIIPEGDR